MGAIVEMRMSTHLWGSIFSGPARPFREWFGESGRLRAAASNMPLSGLHTWPLRPLPCFCFAYPRPHSEPWTKCANAGRVTTYSVQFVASGSSLAPSPAALASPTGLGGD